MYENIWVSRKKHCGGSLGERRNGMGSHFYIKNKNEILVGFNGVEFLAKRVK
jgi:hypothetical protein